MSDKRKLLQALPKQNISDGIRTNIMLQSSARLAEFSGMRARN